MEKERAIQAILIPPQLKHFCKEFNLSISDIEPNFAGWSKHVIMSADFVFLFPRHPKFDHWLEKELQVYKVFTRLSNVPLPKLIRTVDDRKLSYYRFGVVTRMHGVAFSSIELDIGPEKYEHLLRDLGRVTAIWHEIPLDTVPEIIGPKIPDESGDHAESYRWMHQALSPETTDEALSFISYLTTQVVNDIGGNDLRPLSVGVSGEHWPAAMQSHFLRSP